MMLGRFKDEIAGNRLGGTQYPQNEGANRARQAAQTLRQAGKGEQQGDDALQHPPLSSLAKFQSIAASGQFRL